MNPRPRLLDLAQPRAADLCWAALFTLPPSTGTFLHSSSSPHSTSSPRCAAHHISPSVAARASCTRDGPSLPRRSQLTQPLDRQSLRSAWVRCGIPSITSTVPRNADCVFAQFRFCAWSLAVSFGAAPSRPETVARHAQRAPRSASNIQLLLAQHHHRAVHHGKPSYRSANIPHRFHLHPRNRPGRASSALGPASAVCPAGSATTDPYPSCTSSYKLGLCAALARLLDIRTTSLTPAFGVRGVPSGD